MPGTRNVGSNIKEFHKGKTYAKTRRKFGKHRADEQAIAVGIAQAGRARLGKAKRRARGNKSETEH